MRPSIIRRSCGRCCLFTTVTIVRTERCWYSARTSDNISLQHYNIKDDIIVVDGNRFQNLYIIIA